MAERKGSPSRLPLLVMVVVALLVALGVTFWLWQQNGTRSPGEDAGIAGRPAAPGAAPATGAGQDGRVAGTIQGGPGSADAPLPPGVVPGAPPVPGAPGQPGAPGAPPGAGAAEPTPRYPVESIRVAEAAPPIDLPPIEQSDPVIADSMATLVSASGFAEFFFLDNIARRFVVTVDNLPRDTLPMRLRSAKPIPQQFVVKGRGEVVELDASNYQRYERFVRFMLGIDTRVLVALYVRFYPLLQQEYRNLGYPDGFFNDRVVEAIDDLLAAPPIGAPVDLVQPKVMYKYEDPDLEGLSPGQKIMIRIGPANADELKSKLRAIRRQLTGQG